MKNRLFLGLGTVISVLGLSQVSALAADSESGTGTLGATLPLTWCIPFVCMLLCIAVMPLIAGEWWEKHKQWAVAGWSLLFLIPFAIFGLIIYSIPLYKSSVFSRIITRSMSS